MSALVWKVLIMKLFFCLIGLILVIEGLPYFAFPDRMKDWMKRVQDVPDPILRIIGFASMCIGFVMVYLFR